MKSNNHQNKKLVILASLISVGALFSTSISSYAHSHNTHLSQAQPTTPSNSTPGTTDNTNPTNTTPGTNQTTPAPGTIQTTPLPGATRTTPAPGTAETTPAPNAPGTAETTPAPNAPATANANIVELASNNPSFSTFVKAVQAAGMADTLTSGEYTVFAPTDQAVAALPSGTLDYLLQPENQQLLRRVLSYHIIRGTVTSNELSTGGVNTLGGGIAVRVTPERVIVNNGSVVQPNLQASNGVVHAINQVLMPRTLRTQIVARTGGQIQ